MLMSKIIGDKRRYRQYKERVKRLPEDYRTATEAIERYLMHFVPADNESAISEFEDLAELFEQAASDGTPIREVVGDDPAEFAEEFARNYTKGGYAPDKERQRLLRGIERATGEQGAG
ncbi:DNA-binding ferritin-like protein (Dps family) [Actinopolyspora xinjiangensis]|uniref:DNA-binding ferritin-like protein (Dps family) n=2 Tax=Actinopolyspora xinjiangensis TaxID=405564 RepID=A0A1H0V8E2_9ACTN|nr:DNA-binding ferritin-like protein (Dps family) [Actinopolyspora xinjiangensis]